MRIQLRRGTAAQWAAANPVLAESEPGWATDTRVLKIGDGSTAYNGLPAAGGGSSTTADASAAALGLAAHTVAPTSCESQFAAGAGNLLLVRIYLPGTAITTLGTLVRTAGATPNGNENALALYTEAGVLVDKTGSMAAAFQATGWQSGALSGGSQTPAAGAYWLGILANMGTDPLLFASGAITNVPAINGKRSSVFVGGQTAIPASFNPAAATLNSAAYYMSAS